jgi:DNA-directed RNA polymerase subunit E"
MSLRACRNCHLIISANICPECKSTSVSDDWTGVVVIIDPEKSQIAKTLDIKKPGRYALRVR